MLWDIEDENMILCNKCSLWMHKNCDKILTDSVFKTYSSNSNKPYVCGVCRKEILYNNSRELIEKRGTEYIWAHEFLEDFKIKWFESEVFTKKDSVCNCNYLIFI